jgi:hypothetical protein
VLWLATTYRTQVDPLKLIIPYLLTAVLTLSRQDDPVCCGVAFDECCLPPVGQRDRSEFDLAASGDVVAVDRVYGGSGHAMGDSANVIEDVPCRVNVLIDVE